MHTFRLGRQAHAEGNLNLIRKEHAGLSTESHDRKWKVPQHLVLYHE